MKKMFFWMLIAFLAVTIMPAISIAQEDEPTMYASGTVLNISGNTITINETTYDPDTYEETVTESTFTIMPDAEYDNVGSASEIEKGKEVDIEYAEKDGKKQASYIYVYSEE